MFLPREGKILLEKKRTRECGIRILTNTGEEKLFRFQDTPKKTRQPTKIQDGSDGAGKKIGRTKLKRNQKKPTAKNAQPISQGGCRRLDKRLLFCLPLLTLDVPGVSWGRLRTATGLASTSPSRGRKILGRKTPRSRRKKNCRRGTLRRGTESTLFAEKSFMGESGGTETNKSTRLHKPDPQTMGGKIAQKPVP